MPDTEPENKLKTRMPDTDWSNPIIAQTIQGLAAEGYRRHEIGKLMGINADHMKKVILRHPELEEKLTKGKSAATLLVTRTALRVAIGGIEYEEVTVKENKEGEKSKVTVTKTSPPNPTMIIFWLTNRDGDNWKHIREVIKSVKQDFNNAKPESDKIARLFGEISRNDPYEPGSECSVPPKTSRVSRKKRGRPANVSGDVRGDAVNNIQDDVLDVSAEKRAEH